jgi:hypothetical protein
MAPSRERPGARRLRGHRVDADRAARLTTSNSPAVEAIAFTNRQPGANQVWLRAGALILVLGALGPPLNDLPRYALLVIATVVIFSGFVSDDLRAWRNAIAVIVACILGQALFAAPRIEEGHNLFLIDRPGGALGTQLPSSAFQVMAAQFNARYPPERRCDPTRDGCWRGEAFPQEPYAFSSDAILYRPAYSRRVATINFADPAWLRLGFINEWGYNWNSRVSDVDRATRNGGAFAFLHRWRLEMPWFVMYRFPAGYVGSALCWQGDVLWEGAGERFDLVSHEEMRCRTLVDADVGQRIFGLAISPQRPLAMRLDPSRAVLTVQLTEAGLTFVAVAAVLGFLVRWRVRKALLALGLTGLSLLIVLLHDASFIGGVRPFDSGDDGLVYEGYARDMLRKLIGGNVAGALEGGEKVFYFTPGLRYLRSLEHVIFGETFLGYLSLVLLLPFLVFAIFRRFLPADWAVACVLIFVAVPVGMLFGSSFVQYVKWAARGFADPAAYIFFLAGLVVLVGCSSEGPRSTFAGAMGAGLLLALALFMRPNIAPAAGILIASSSVQALRHRQYRRITGLAVGFLPVLGMALHNWVYGGAFVLFTSTAQIPGTLVMPPSAYLAAAGELARLDLFGEHVVRAIRQIGGWLAGPSESPIMAPMNAAALIILARMAIWKEIDPWLRLISGATLVQQCVGLFYASAGRYYYLTWLLTVLVTVVWIRREGLGLFQQRYPNFSIRFTSHPSRHALARLLLRMAPEEHARHP